jgi:hypothetical protein
MPETEAELMLYTSVAQYVNRGSPSQADREVRIKRLVEFLTDSESHIPTKYVVWWVLIAFALGTQWRVFLAAFHA